MAYKILVTTVATRPDAVSIDTKVVEIEGLMTANVAVKKINDQKDSWLGNANVRQTALALDFLTGD